MDMNRRGRERKGKEMIGRGRETYGEEWKRK